MARKNKMSLKDRMTGDRAKENFQKIKKLGGGFLGKALSMATGGAISPDFFKKAQGESDEDFKQRMNDAKAGAVGGAATANPPSNQTASEKVSYLAAKYGKFGILAAIGLGLIFGIKKIITKKSKRW